MLIFLVVVDKNRYLNVAAGNCGHRGEQLTNIPGVHSLQQKLLEARGVCLL